MDTLTKKTLQNVNDTLNKALEEAYKRRNEEDRKYIISAIGSDLVKILDPLLKQIAENSRMTREELKSVLKEITVEIPVINIEPANINVSVPNVNVPEIKIPVIKLPTIKVPKSEVTVKVPKIEMPNEMKVKGMEDLIAGINEILKPKEVSDSPMRVVLTDEKGMEYTAKSGGVVSGGGGGVSVVKNELPLGFEQLAISSTAVGLASIPEKANKAVMTIEDATLRYRDDGTAPTATVGLKVFSAGTIILNSRSSIMSFKAIITGATDSEINVLYYEVS